MAKKITMRAASEILACLFARHLSQRKRVDCELFIGILGGSKYTFAEATHTQRLENLLTEAAP
ncbi:hypothetical protein D3C87_866460 [compost metagenome]